MSIQNEPDFTPSGSGIPYLAGCYLANVEDANKAGYPQALAAVKSAFQTAGFGSMKMIGPDTSGVNGDKVPSYINNLPAGSLSAIAHHLYGANSATTGSFRLSQLQTQYPWWNYDKFMTEMNPGDDLGPDQPDWMGLALTMHNVFTLECANTYMVWSIMWNTINPGGSAYTNQEAWRFQNFGTIADAGDAAGDADPDQDGECNLYEFATSQDPNASTFVVPTVLKSGTNVEMTYVRSIDAINDGCIFTVEWADTLLDGSWSPTGVSEQILGANERTQTVKASVTAGTNKRFLRLRVFKN